jgi:hypothetical protein
LFSFYFLRSVLLGIDLETTKGENDFEGFVEYRGNEISVLMVNDG